MSPDAPDRGRRVAAALLVVEALLVVSPLFALASWWVGAQLIGKVVTQVRLLDVLVVALAVLAAPLLTLLVLAAAHGVARGRRRLPALALQPVVAAALLVPFTRPQATLARVPGGTLVALAVVVATTAALVIVRDRSDRAPARSRTIRVAWVVVLATLLAGIVVGGLSTRLPSYPLLWLAPGAQSTGARPAPVPAAAPAQNPSLAPDPFNSIHNDSWATDAYLIPGPRDPVGAPADSLFTGGDCASLTFDGRGRLLTLCSSLTTVTAWAVDPVTMTALAREQVGTRPASFTDFSGGGYFVLDAADRMVMPLSGGRIQVVALEDGPGGPRFAVTDAWDVTSVLGEGEAVTSVVPDWLGRLWFVGATGTVGLVEPDTGAVRATRLAGESIENSFAVTEDAVYVVTGAAMYRLWAAPGAAPAVVWREPYDVGVTQKPGQTSRASGTTPTVFDDGALVAITDNAEPRMNVVVMRTDPVAERVVCAAPVFAEGASATENSLVAVGRSLLVENNFGYRPAFTSVAAGGTVQPGVARVDVDPATGSCPVAWENGSVHVPSLVSKASAADGLLLTWTKPPSVLGLDVWYATALDLVTGDQVWTRPMGGGLPFNNHYASLALGPGGDLFVGTTTGIVALRSGP